MASIDDYINIQKKYNKNGDRFEYIHFRDYRSQFVLVLTQSDRFSAEYFKELLSLYSGIRIYLDSNADYDELYAVAQSSDRPRKKHVYDYDSMLLDEDVLEIVVSDITKYPNLEENIHMSFSQK